jgi:hypothetical protein
MWKKCTQGLSGNDCNTGTGGRYDWKEALQLVNNYSFASHNDWRLPNIAIAIIGVSTVFPLVRNIVLTGLS